MYKSFFKDLNEFGYKFNKFTNVIENNSINYMNFYSQIKYYVPVEENFIQRW